MIEDLEFLAENFSEDLQETLQKRLDEMDKENVPIEQVDLYLSRFGYFRSHG